MSVDEIINSAISRKDQRRNTPHQNYQNYQSDSPPTKEFSQPQSYSPNIYYRDDSGSRDYEAEPEPQVAPTPQPSTNDIIERKIEEVFKRYMDSNRINSLRNSRESSLGANLSAPEYWNAPPPQYPVQSTLNNSFGSVQPVFHTAPDLSQQNDYIQLKKKVDELAVTLTEKEAEVVWLNMKLQDEKLSASRTTLNRDHSRGTLHRDNSRSSVIGFDNKLQETQIENLTKEKDKLDKRVKQLELEKIQIERSRDEIEKERDQLRIQVSYLQNGNAAPNSSQKLDIVLENKVTKQKLLEAKEDYSKLLNENLQYKERWEKETQVREEFKNSVEKHQSDVKKALKIHKANEELAKKNVELKNEMKQLREQMESPEFQQVSEIPK